MIGVADAGAGHGAPTLVDSSREVQAFDALMPVPIALTDQVRRDSVRDLNPVLIETIMLRDLHKKHNWQTLGPTFYQLHLLYDKHFSKQSELVDALAERIQSVGGLSVAMPQDVAEATEIPRPQRGRKDVPAQLSRLVRAHEIVLGGARPAASSAAQRGDDGTNDLLLSQVVRTNETQAWFLAEHLANPSTAPVDGMSAQVGLGPRNG
jgi:starvation-inducible DNA-binding protein